MGIFRQLCRDWFGTNDKKQKKSMFRRFKDACSNDVELYHYTDELGALGIWRSGIIRNSKFNEGYSTIGKGVYMTTLKPVDDMSDIVSDIYDDAEAADDKYSCRTDYYFKFNASDLPGAIKSKNNEWVYPHDIKLENVSFEFGETNNNDVDYWPEFSYDNYGQPPYCPNLAKH